MTIRRKRLALLSLALVAVLAGGEKNKEEEGEHDAPGPWRVNAPRRAPTHHITPANAALYPVNQANVTPKISSPVRRMHVNRGDHVREGQIIAELEAADLSAAVN